MTVDRVRALANAADVNSLWPLRKRYGIGALHPCRTVIAWPPHTVSMARSLVRMRTPAVAGRLGAETAGIPRRGEFVRSHAPPSGLGAFALPGHNRNLRGSVYPAVG
ncbi:hypothetical protein SAMN05216241_11070 [Limimonas halophila]|uniref:Uncharacterized protein n=1 Tax=Limimonas halophila TaxID=1082479 RepID=A0A1G7TTH8_9PROT|nr:hypothetical protein SAMN05216241_11070 [Limimonas halophila]